MPWGNPTLQQIDITEPDMVQVEWDQARKVLYVHTDGYTALRMCRIDNIEFVGLRQPPLPDPDLALQQIVDYAQDAFWSVVAALHPDIKTGDFTPNQQMMFNQACRNAVYYWLENNR